MRNGFLPEDKDQRVRRLMRGASIAVSLVIHTFLILALVQARIKIKILPVRKEVRDVFIVSHERMRLPVSPDQYFKALSSQNSGSPESQKSGAPPELQGQGTAGSPEKTPVADNRMDRGGTALSPSSPSTPERDLALNSRFQEYGNSKFRIDLSVIPDRVPDAPLGFGAESKGNRSFLKSIRPGRAGFEEEGRYASTGTRGGGRGGGQAGASFLSPGYDITPWARKVIDIIQVKWRIPNIQNVVGKNKVQISVVVEKNGDISAMKMLGGSSLDLLNSSAIHSLEQSSPFPPLPDDFPASNLPVLFVFVYYD